MGSVRVTIDVLEERRHVAVTLAVVPPDARPTPGPGAQPALPAAEYGAQDSSRAAPLPSKAGPVGIRAGAIESKVAHAARGVVHGAAHAAGSARAGTARAAGTVGGAARTTGSAAARAFGAARGVAGFAARAGGAARQAGTAAAHAAGGLGRVALSVLLKPAVSGDAGDSTVLGRLEGKSVLVVCGRVTPLTERIVQGLVANHAARVVLATRDLKQGRALAARVLDAGRPRLAGARGRALSRGLGAASAAGGAAANAAGAAAGGAGLGAVAEAAKEGFADGGPLGGHAADAAPEPRGGGGRGQGQQPADGRQPPASEVVCARALSMTSADEVRAYASYLTSEALGPPPAGGGAAGAEGAERGGGGGGAGAGALDSVIFDVPSLAPGRGDGAALHRRWYSPEGAAGMAQLHLVGPFTLLRCLEPQLAAGRARVVFSVSMTHRLATLPSPRDFVGAWHKGTGPRCQLAAAALACELQRRLGPAGVTACVADAGITRDDLPASLCLLPGARGALGALCTPPGDAAGAALHAAAAEWGSRRHAPRNASKDLRLYTRGLRASPVLAALGGPATTWPLVSSVLYAPYAAAALAAAAADRAAAPLLGAAPPAPVAAAAAPAAADAALGRALWAAAAAVSGMGEGRASAALVGQQGQKEELEGDQGLEEQEAAAQEGEGQRGEAEGLQGQAPGQQDQEAERGRQEEQEGQERKEEERQGEGEEDVFEEAREAAPAASTQAPEARGDAAEAAEPMPGRRDAAGEGEVAGLAQAGQEAGRKFGGAAQAAEPPAAQPPAAQPPAAQPPAAEGREGRPPSKEAGAAAAGEGPEQGAAARSEGAAAEGAPRAGAEGPAKGVWYAESPSGVVPAEAAGGAPEARG